MERRTRDLGCYLAHPELARLHRHAAATRGGRRDRHRSISVAHLLNLTRRLGRGLNWDPAKEQFIGDEEANRLVDLPRRKGYELPVSL